MFETQITKQQASTSSILLFTAIRDKPHRPIETQLFFDKYRTVPKLTTTPESRQWNLKNKYWLAASTPKLAYFQLGLISFFNDQLRENLKLTVTHIFSFIQVP